MSRVVTGLGAPPAQASSSSRPQTLSDRFAAIDSQPGGTSDRSSGGRRQSGSKQHNGAQSSSTPVLPLTTSPTKSNRPARKLKLRGGSTVSVGAAGQSNGTGGRKQRNVQLQKEKRASALNNKRQIVKQAKPNNGQGNGSGNNRPKQPKQQQQQTQQQPQQQPFNFLPAFASVLSAPSPFTSPFLQQSAFPSAFHPGVINQPAPMQLSGGRGAGRSGVKGRGGPGRVQGVGAGGRAGQQQQQRNGVKGKGGNKGKAAVGTAARVAGVVGQRGSNSGKGKGSRRMSSNKGGKADGAAGEVTSTSLDSEMEVYNAGQPSAVTA